MTKVRHLRRINCSVRKTSTALIGKTKSYTYMIIFDNDGGNGLIVAVNGKITTHYVIHGLTHFPDGKFRIAMQFKHTGEYVYMESGYDKVTNPEQIAWFDNYQEMLDYIKTERAIRKIDRRRKKVRGNILEV